MDEQIDAPRPVHPADQPGGQQGDPVEAVLATLDGLEDRPVAEHVAVFEHAHESLRRVLAGDASRG